MDQTKEINIGVKTQRKISKPDWLKIQLPNTADYKWMNNTIRDNKLHTICTSGKCPNAAECWSAGTATFMILGDICTRSCKFCNVNRITSYNVCYTKLLRSFKSFLIVPTAFSKFEVNKKRLVITSYSIHYTKLYEAACSSRRSCARRWHRSGGRRS